MHQRGISLSVEIPIYAVTIGLNYHKDVKEIYEEITQQATAIGKSNKHNLYLQR